jgi:hypothetical protein
MHGGFFMSLDLKQDVFHTVVSRIAERSDSLRDVKRVANVGIDGWFKVEIIAALGERLLRSTIKDQTSH